MSISLKGFNDKYITLQAGEPCTVGSPVDVTAENTAADKADGSFAGVCAAREGDLALVQVTGFVTLPADAAASALSLGAGAVTLAAGKLKNGDGRSAIVAAIRDGVAEVILL